MEETKIIANKVSSKFFMWQKTTNTFVTEASDLPTSFNPESQVWNDSMDAGFVMESEKTGQKLIFFKAGTDKNSEGEIEGFLFRAFPQFNKMLTQTINALIIND